MGKEIANVRITQKEIVISNWKAEVIRENSSLIVIQ